MNARRGVKDAGRGVRDAGRLRRVVAAVTVLAAVFLGQSALAGAGARAATTPSVPLPLGRATYVISMMDGRPGAIAVRLATYAFTRDGRVTERYWSWRQDSISGKDNVRWTKPGSGYTTAGCLRACPVRTPIGFQRGAAPRTSAGRWAMEPGGVLAIRWWASASVERWRLDGSRPGIAGARLLVPAGSTAVGWGVGSNAAAGKGVALSSVYATGAWITGPFTQNVYAPTTQHASIGWSAADYSLCQSGRCMQGRKLTASDRRSWYHSYFAADPGVDGRKVYWNNQTGIVQQLENPRTVCISASGGGHTNALLQVLDDGGRFVGFVGVEASLNQRKYGQDVVAAYAMLMPSLLPAIGSF